MLQEMLSLTYWFYPNPANAEYANPKAIALLAVCIALVLASFVLPYLRNRWQNPQLKKVSKTWATAAGWLGWIGLVLVICRVEEIQYLSMRFLWVLWGIAAALYLVLQVRVYRSRYYEVIPNRPTQDARAAYLPTRKKR